MISNTCYELINTACDLIGYWQPRLERGMIGVICPRYELSENLKDYYRYVAWAEDYNQSEENY